jgi:hypothetical protein
MLHLPQLVTVSGWHRCSPYQSPLLVRFVVRLCEGTQKGSAAAPLPRPKLLQVDLLAAICCMPLLPELLLLLLLQHLLLPACQCC